ncbi:MAG: hypothetical protein NDJ92_20005 [Thermoanaerobaculia bacterium]|nr:hypothetical protein [Thermoanaerobaculia bacterium]
MRKLTLALLAIVCLTAGSTAMAELCAADPVPAATLLLPYFEVDLQDPNGITTLFSVTNASASAAVFHVVLWSDLSVPVLDFDVYLTGYDTQVINLRDIIVNGVFPRTADDGADTTDTISPQGPLSQDINFPGSTGPCVEAFPVGSIGSIYTTHMQAALTGTFSPLLGGCAGQVFGDNIARGYATLDSVTQCSLLFPGDAGYFAGGIADTRNILFGDYQYVNPSQNFAQGESMVSIESSSRSFSGGPAAYGPFVAGDYTFYGRYVGWTGIDQREPLPSMWGVRYNTGGAASAGTDLIVWRDSTRAQGTFACNARPPWFPLASNNVIAFDEEENPYQAPGCTVSPCSIDEGTPFPAEAQRVAVGVDPIFTPAESGWIYLNLNTAVLGSQNPNIPLAQSWVVAIGSSEGRFSYGANATALNNLCVGGDVILIP